MQRNANRDRRGERGGGGEGKREHSLEEPIHGDILDPDSCSILSMSILIITSFFLDLT